jgi:hypothetical protein
MQPGAALAAGGTANLCRSGGVRAKRRADFGASWLVRATQEIAGRLNTTIAFWLVVLVYVVLGLLEVDDASRRVRAMENREAARVLVDGSRATAMKSASTCSSEPR